METPVNCGLVPWLIAEGSLRGLSTAPEHAQPRVLMERWVSLCTHPPGAELPRILPVGGHWAQRAYLRTVEHDK